MAFRRPALPGTRDRAAIAAVVTLGCLGWWQPSHHSAREVPPASVAPAPAAQAVLRPAVVRAAVVLAPAVTPACGTQTTTVLSLPDRTGPRQVQVVRPGVRDSPAIPVLYLLHGFPGSAAAMASTARGLVRAACATGHPLVVAVPDGNDGDLDTEWADSENGADDLETFVTTATVQAVEGVDVRPPANRIIGGFSMGGFGAAAIGMRHPREFGRILAISGYFHVDDPDRVFGGVPSRVTAHRPDHLARRGSGQRYLLIEGSHDGESLVQGEADRFATVLRAQALPVSVLHPDAGHTIRVIDPVLPAVLAFLR